MRPNLLSAGRNLNAHSVPVCVVNILVVSSECLLLNVMPLGVDTVLAYKSSTRRS